MINRPDMESTLTDRDLNGIEDVDCMGPVAATAVITTGVGAITVMRLVGQIDPGVTQLVGNLGVIGVLIWYLWHSTTHSYPRMQAAFSQEMERQRTAHASEMAEMRQMLMTALQGMRTAVHDVKDTAHGAILKTAAMAQEQQKANGGKGGE